MSAHEVYMIDGIPGTTTEVLSEDTAKGLPSGILTDASGNPCETVLITVEDNPIRYAHNVNPVSDGAGELGHRVAASGIIKLHNSADVTTFTFISATAGSAAKLFVTPYFREET